MCIRDRTSIKTTKEAAVIAQKTAKTTAKATQKAAQTAKKAAKATADTVKATAKATVATVKACSEHDRRPGWKCQFNRKPARLCGKPPQRGRLN